MNALATLSIGDPHHPGFGRFAAPNAAASSAAGAVTRTVAASPVPPKAPPKGFHTQDIREGPGGVSAKSLEGQAQVERQARAYEDAEKASKALKELRGGSDERTGDAAAGGVALPGQSKGATVSPREATPPPKGRANEAMGGQKQTTPGTPPRAREGGDLNATAGRGSGESGDSGGIEVEKGEDTMTVPPPLMRRMGAKGPW